MVFASLRGAYHTPGGRATWHLCAFFSWGAISVWVSSGYSSRGRVLYIADTQNDPRSALAAADRSVGLRTYLGLPITIRGEVVGVLTFN